MTASKDLSELVHLEQVPVLPVHRITITKKTRKVVVASGQLLPEVEYGEEQGMVILLLVSLLTQPDTGKCKNLSNVSFYGIS